MKYFHLHDNHLHTHIHGFIVDCSKKTNLVKNTLDLSWKHGYFINMGNIGYCPFIYFEVLIFRRKQILAKKYRTYNFDSSWNHGYYELMENIGN